MIGRLPDSELVSPYLMSPSIANACGKDYLIEHFILKQTNLSQSQPFDKMKREKDNCVTCSLLAQAHSFVMKTLSEPRMREKNRCPPRFDSRFLTQYKAWLSQIAKSFYTLNLHRVTQINFSV